MSKPESQKRWQQRNADKVRGYTAKYLSGKTKVSVTVDHWVVEELAKIKPPEKSLGGWLRDRLEKWAQASRSGTVRPTDDLF